MSEGEMSKHTPGPWLKGAPSSVVGWPIVAPKSGRLICNIASGGPGDTEAEGNAEFVAAAPETAAERDRLKALVGELVEAVEAAIHAIEPQPSLSMHEWAKELNATGIQLKRVLAKAKGE